MSAVLELFIAYLAIHWPNHWAIKALAGDLHHGIIRAGTIEDLSQEIELTEQDAKTLKAIWEGKSRLL